MIKIIHEKPKCFDYLDDDMVYINFYRGNKNYLNMAIQVFGKTSSVHIKYRSWSHNILKQTKRDWERVKLKLAKCGVKKVIASYPDATDVKWKKFIKHFGFPEPQKILISEQEL